MRYLNENILNAAAAQTDVTGSAIDASYLVSASVIATGTTGVSSAIVHLQASNDPAIATAPVNWVDIATVTVTTNSTYMIAKQDLCYRWIRVTYAHGSSASGTITINLECLGF